MPIQVVWFKRDLRVLDHEPLARAARRGPCVCLYAYEPEILTSSDFDPSHLVFINQALAELGRSLSAIGGCLTLRVGRMPAILDDLDRSFGVEALWSHQETGGAITYARDRRVARWARSRGIPWHEFPQDGVVRRLRSRDGWAGLWSAAMDRPEVAPPRAIVTPAGLEPGRLLEPTALGLPRSLRTEAQRGGASSAGSILRSFLDHRGVDYPRTISSPSTARRGCSRLSPHLAWGCVSTRQVHQAIRDRELDLAEARWAGLEVDRRWAHALRSFRERLRWRGHFMQKLEDEPAIEVANFSRAYDGLRESDFDLARFEAWGSGRTGYPMVDACMRALHLGGWINFRMRAMLMSFASYHLWLHWRPTSLHLARLFLDFEPGIHFPQAQMQSGTTGINTLRIYSPARQVLDHDPRGLFIRRYVPELEPVPDEYLAEPHTMPRLLQKLIGCEIGRDYPAPIVDHARAFRAARDRMDAVRDRPEAVREARRVLIKHGSRGKRRA
jgi:deoxyribodipyrimidine photo-lyase